MFSQASVKNSAYRGGLHPGGDLPSEGSLHSGRWIDPSDTMGYGQPAGGAHPTGMHSCLYLI